MLFYSFLYAHSLIAVHQAGTSRHKPTENVANCLKYVTLAEEVDAVVGTLPKFLKNEYPPEVPKADLYCGYYTKVNSFNDLNKYWNHTIKNLSKILAPFCKLTSICYIYEFCENVLNNSIERK